MARNKQRRLGQRLVAEVSKLGDVLRAKKPIEKRYQVRTVKLDVKPKPVDLE